MTQYLTEERYEELRQELERLRGEVRQEVAEQLKHAKEYGDLSENSEYAEAREMQSRTEARIAELDETLKSASIIHRGLGGDMVQVGSIVTVKKEGKTIKYTIVGSNESNPAEFKISNESPLGKAFLGHKTGDKVKVETPNGIVEYAIESIG